VFFSSFQTRLVVFFVGLLFVALSASFLAVNQAQVRNANRVITADLAEDAAVFRRLFSDRTERLLEAARLLSSDFAFKIAYSTGEHATIVSAMENHLARIVGADTMLLVSLDDDILADTSLPEGGVERRNPWPWIAAAALDDDYGEAASIVMLDDHLMQMMVVPFMVPDLDAWIFIGFLLNDDYALMFEELILSRVSILHETVDVPGTCRNVASTLDGSDRNRLAILRDAGELPADTARTVRMNGDGFVSSVIPVSRSADDLVLAVLQRSLDEELVAGARRIDEGDYAQRVEIDRKDEIGVLAASFNRMAKGLAEKERVRDLLGKVVSPAIAEELLSKEHRPRR